MASSSFVHEFTTVVQLNALVITFLPAADEPGSVVKQSAVRAGLAT